MEVINRDNMENYLKEAFQKLNLLDECMNFSMDSGKIDKLKEFMEDDREAFPEEEVYYDSNEVELEKEDELPSDWSIGKVILRCECCGSKFPVDEEDVVLNDDQTLANIDQECEICNQCQGFKVIGKIEPFEEVENKEELPADDIDDEDEFEEKEEDKVKESLHQKIRRKFNESLKESNDISNLDDKDFDKTLDIKEFGNYYKEKYGVNKAPFHIEDGDFFVVDVTPRDCGIKTRVDEDEWDDFYSDELSDIGYGLETDPFGTYKEIAEEIHSAIEEFKKKAQKEFGKNESLTNRYKRKGIKEAVEVNATGEDEVHVNKNDDGTMDIRVGSNEQLSGGASIVPLDDEDEISIENNVNPDEEGEEPVESDEVEFEDTGEQPEEQQNENESFKQKGKLVIEDFDDSKFNSMTESYMRKVYENVNKFTTTSVKELKEGILTVNGVIKFKSGKEKQTSFIFENAKFSRRGKLVLEGKNNTFTKSKKPFTLRGSLHEGKFTPSDMVYNYSIKQLNESTGETELLKICGRVK